MSEKAQTHIHKHTNTHAQYYSTQNNLAIEMENFQRYGAQIPPSPLNWHFYDDMLGISCPIPVWI